MVVVAVLSAALICLAAAALLLPDSYGWTLHGVRESAAQGIDLAPRRLATHPTIETHRGVDQGLDTQLFDQRRR